MCNEDACIPNPSRNTPINEYIDNNDQMLHRKRKKNIE